MFCQWMRTCFCLVGSKLLESKQAPIAKANHLARGPLIDRGEMFEEVNNAAKA
jgi:hypothetical protein